MSLFIVIYFSFAFINVFSAAMIYLFVVLPCLDKNGFNGLAESRRLREYRQVLRAEKILKSENTIKYLLVRWLVSYQKGAIINLGKTCFYWAKVSLIIFLLVTFTEKYW